jgi:two-component system nitrate/nitrite response regulator NarL
LYDAGGPAVTREELSRHAVDGAPHSPVRVLIADLHPLFRGGFSQAIDNHPKLTLVGEAAEGHAALECIIKARPDVAVLDVALSGIDGMGILNVVIRDRLATRVLFLSSEVEQRIAYEMLERGAAGLLSKQADAEQVCDAIAAVARGEVVVDAHVQKKLASEIRLRAGYERPLLTDREYDVIRLVAQGLRAPDIAKTLHLSTSTVRSHLGHLYEKLGVSDRAAAGIEAVRRGLIE